MAFPNGFFLFIETIFFFVGIAKVNSRGWLFGKQGREERGRESERVQMCPDKHYISIDMCWGPSAARVKISEKRRPCVERQAQPRQLQGLLLDQRCHACILEPLEGARCQLGINQPPSDLFSKSWSQRGVWVMQTLESSSISVLHCSEVGNLNFSQLAVWEPIRPYLKRNSLPLCCSDQWKPHISLWRCSEFVPGQ